MNRTIYTLLPLALLATCALPLPGQESADSLVALPWNREADYWRMASVATPVSLSRAEQSPVYDLRNKLTGVVPGLEVTEVNGNIMPESNMGNSYLNASTLQLNAHGLSNLVLIVDDILIPFNQYQFDINQIESMTLLTGATAKAAYGPRAGYGALYVTTRKGAWNKPLTVQADLRAGVDFVDRQPAWVTGYEYAVLNNRARENDGYPQLYDNSALVGYAAGDPFSRKYPSVDYQSLMMGRVKTTQNFSVDLSGGTSILRYNASVNGYRGDDIFSAGPYADFNRLNISSSVSARIGQWITGTVSFNGLTAFRRSNNASVTSYRSIPGIAFPVAVGISTNESDLEGISAGNTIYAVSRAYTSNPYAQLVDGGFATTRYRSAMFNAAVDFDMGWLLKGLKSRTMLDFDSEYYQKVGKNNDYIAYYWSRESDIAEISSHVGTKQASKSSLGTFTYNNLHFSERLSYEHAAGAHALKASALFFLSDGSNASNSFYERQAYGVAHADYSYAGRYFVEVVGQYAGSSRFAAGNRYAFFPSAALGWLASEEPFLRGVSWIDRLKVSVDVGSIGEADVFGTQYLYRAAYVSASGNTFGPATAYQWFGSDKRTSQPTTISRLANHDLHWSRMFQADLRIDARLFGGLDLSAGLYRIHRGGLITEISSEYPAMAGLTDIDIYDNYNSYEITGVDLNAQYTRNFGDFRLSFGGNLMSWTTIYGEYANDFYVYDWQRVSGTRYGSYRGLVCTGRFTSEEEIASSPLYDANTKVGDLKYKDLNEDGNIDDNDRCIVGNTSPLLRFSVNLDLRWKNWNLLVVGTGHAGVDLPLTSEYFWNGWGDGNYSAFVRDNIGGDYPRLGYDKSANNFTASNFWLRDGSYFKVQTAELGYTFVPKHGKALKSVKFSLRGANLLTLSGIRYIDPESTTAGVTAYPLFRTVAAGVKLNF